MFGPVFALELMRERRRGVYWRLLPWGYAALLAFIVVVVWHDALPAQRSLQPFDVPALLIPGRVRQVIDQHFLVLFLLTPALTATSFGEEKAKGTLADLFTTSLTSLEIVGGKLVARSLQVVSILLPSLPILFIVGGYAGVPVTFFAALLIVSLLVVVGLGAVGVLCAVVCKHTSAAILLAYALVGVGGLLASLVLPALDPLATLELASESTAPRTLALFVGEAATAWLVVALVCFAVAV
jgi:ABC-type transport system involved in multi-copper enzyme maturation permease subunit